MGKTPRKTPKKHQSKPPSTISPLTTRGGIKKQRALATRIAKQLMGLDEDDPIRQQFERLEKVVNAKKGRNGKTTYDVITMFNESNPGVLTKDPYNWISLGGPPSHMGGANVSDPTVPKTPDATQISTAAALARKLFMDTDTVQSVRKSDKHLVKDEGKHDGDPLDPSDTTPLTDSDASDSAVTSDTSAASDGAGDPKMPSMPSLDPKQASDGGGCGPAPKNQVNAQFPRDGGGAAGVAAPVGTPGLFGYNQFKATPPFAVDITSGGAGGDTINDVKSINNSESNLRPLFGMESAVNVIPSGDEQLKSDIMFDMFDTIHEGFGNGEDNKLFLMDQNRDEKIIFAGPPSFPGSSIGPESGVGVTTWKLQRQIPTEEMALYERSVKTRLAAVSELLRDPDQSTNVLGDDVGFDRSVSAKGLKRNRMSVFEPIIQNAMEFSRVKMPTGAELNGMGFRLSTDAMRYPRHVLSRTNGMGGPTLNKRRSLEIILR